MKFKLGDTDIPFVFRGDEMMYPNYIKDGLILHYDFSGMTNTDASRSIATDLSGNGNHGTLQNFNYTAESGYDKNKLLFDGVDDYIQADKFDLSGDFTIDFTFEALSNENRETLVYLTESQSSFGYVFLVQTSRIRYWTDPSNAGSGINVNQFGAGLGLQNVSVVYEGGILKIYRNGLPESSENLDFNLNSQGFFLGRYTSVSEEPFSGIYHSSKVYNRPLTPSEISHNYAIEKERFGIE